MTRTQQPALAVEVGEHCGLGDAQALGDLGGGGALVALLGEDLAAHRRMSRMRCSLRALVPPRRVAGSAGVSVVGMVFLSVTQFVSAATLINLKDDPSY
jgi:hypothetical protein